jgi:hypothetical protein
VECNEFTSNEKIFVLFLRDKLLRKLHYVTPLPPKPAGHGTGFLKSLKIYSYQYPVPPA